MEGDLEHTTIDEGHLPVYIKMRVPEVHQSPSNTDSQMLESVYMKQSDESYKQTSL